MPPVLTVEPEGTLLLETVVRDAEEFFVWISRYGPEAEILEPEHCRITMLEHLERWRQVYNSR